MAKKDTTAENYKEVLAQIGFDTETVKTKRTKPEPLTLLKAFELLLEMAEDSKLLPAKFTRAKKLTDFIGRILDITPTQAVLFAIILNGDRDEYVQMDYISRFLACKNVRLLSYLNDFDALERKGFVSCKRRRDDHGFRVPMHVLDALKENRRYERPNLSGLTIEQLFIQLETLYIKRDEMEISIDMLAEELKSLFDKNLHLHFCQLIKNYKLDDDDMMLLVFFAHKLINDSDDAITLSQFSDVFDGSYMYRNARNQFRSGRHILLKRGLVEPNNEEGMFDGHSFHLSDSSKRELLGELNLKVEEPCVPRGLKLHTDIVAKTMFYNPTEQAQVARLQSLLDENQYADIARRLSEKGMRTGFTCLFYGAPGTGKTETVLQLARLTGRDIMQVDIPEIKSKWVGDSEKNIKAVFERYRRAIKDCEKAPILLFNEADAVLGMRKEGAEHSVDKMENAIQNIILQEMETLQGIMIATTNLTGSLDKAFERRFLYKIKFEKPSLEAKRSIWRSMIPELDEFQAQELAEGYEFSGGQIENIARKKAVDDILNGDQGINMVTMRSYCDSELIDTRHTARVGFC